MRRIRLTATEQAQLDHIFKTTTDRRLRDHCQAVLMASRGRKRRIIAQDVGVHRTTVQRWLTQYQERDVAGLVCAAVYADRPVSMTAPMGRAGGFARRLLREMDALWVFLAQRGVDEPTNNRAERALPLGVQWRKRSLGTASTKGNRWVERLLSLQEAVSRPEPPMPCW